MNFKQQLAVVEGLLIPPDTEMRMDCPFCSNKNTLTVNTTDGSIGWYCFHASCTAKGRKQGEKNMSYVNTTFKQKDESLDTEFYLPDSFKSVHSNEKAMMYLHKNNCWEAWSWGRADIKYDVKQDRVVFLIRNEHKAHEHVGAIGRALSSATYPKWYMYANKDVPFICGICDDAVIVEDCASACAVSNILTGVSIMGTSLKQSHKKFLNSHKNLYVALDRDATTKSFEIASELRLGGFENVHVKTLTDDLKYFNTEEIKEMFYGK